MLAWLYFKMKKFAEFLNYSFSASTKRRIIVLTFDDYVDKKNIELASYLKSKNISATFFLTLDQTEPELISRLVSMGHEVGGHSLSHSRKERNEKYRTSAAECYKKLKKHSNEIISWRFPWTSKDHECIINVKSAGFTLDSSVGAFYPAKKLQTLGDLYEIPWLRLPKQWQMDVNEPDYSVIKTYITKMVSSKIGVFVFGFHTYRQFEHFNEFKGLIENLLKMDVEFMTLQKSFDVLKNGSL